MPWFFLSWEMGWIFHFFSLKFQWCFFLLLLLVENKSHNECHSSFDLVGIYFLFRWKLSDVVKWVRIRFISFFTYCSRSVHSLSQSGHWNSIRPSSSLSRSTSASVEIFRSLLLLCKSFVSSSIAPLCWEPAIIQWKPKYESENIKKKWVAKIRW